MRAEPVVERESLNIKQANIANDPSQHHIEVMTKNFLCWEGKGQRARWRWRNGLEWLCGYEGSYKVGGRKPSF